jgi:tyrosyl-tRNA synthetase
MSKSLGNYVGVTESPTEMFGKLMSISDDLMWRYYPLLTDLDERAVSALKQQVAEGVVHPKRAKSDLARRVVSDFHGSEQAERAASEFERVHARGELPGELREVAVVFQGGTKALTRVIVDAGLAPSASEAGRKIQQGGVHLNGERQSDPRSYLSAEDLPAVLRVGRHAVRLISTV